MNEELLSIARRLGFDTLEIRKSDRLDFREVAVWQVREALEAAYEAGKRAARDEKGGQATGEACPLS
jgi:uncharacterized protein DUF6900